MDKRQALEMRKQVLRAGALMRQADFCERGVDSDVISFMVESAFLRLGTKLDKKPVGRPKKETKPVQLAKVIQFKRKET